MTVTRYDSPEAEIDGQNGAAVAGEDRPALDGPDAGEQFGRLFDTYAAPLHRYLARRVGTEQARDLVSETFLVAFRQRESYDPTASAVRAWLYGIATNLAGRHVRQEIRGLRATARADSRAEVIHPPHDGQVADRVDAQVLARRIAPAVANLSDGDRDVLFLTSWTQLTTVEVAASLGIPVGTVRSRLHRIRRLLRTQSASNQLISSHQQAPEATHHD